MIYPSCITELMNDVQRVLMEMYRDIEAILRNHGIQFYGYFGTAIGALRHDGFIPWDDDVDLVVWEEDLPLINEVLLKNLDSEKYYYHVPTADTHPHVIYKGDDLEQGLRDKTAPFIDLFPMSRYPTGRFRQLFCDGMIWGVNISVFVIDHIGPLWIHRALCWMPGMFQRLATWMVNDDSDLTVVYATEFKDYIFPRNLFGKGQEHAFEGHPLPLPDGINEILTSMYGDYMTPPPEDKRTGAGGFPCSAYKDYLLETRKTEK